MIVTNGKNNIFITNNEVVADPYYYQSVKMRHNMDMLISSKDENDVVLKNIDGWNKSWYKQS